jgi:hypothetical protein
MGELGRLADVREKVLADADRDLASAQDVCGV